MNRNRLLLVIFLTLSFLQVSARKDNRQIVQFETNKGNICIALFDETPQHRDNFVKLVSQGYYDGTLFHRVIRDFMIQGGDPDSKGAPKGKMLGDGGPEYTLPAEIRFPDLYHKRGMVAAARESDDVNPEFRSSGSQFYIVWGRRMNSVEAKKYRQKWYDEGIEDTHFIIDDYQQYGGTPHLDGSYTVFGEVVEGLNVVKEIQSVSTDRNDRPLDDVVVLKAYVLTEK